MPKVVGSALTRTNEFSAEGLHSSDINVLFCKFCNGYVRWECRDTKIKHINNEKHVNNKRLYSEKTSLQQTICSSFQVVNKQISAADNFDKTTAAFLKVNIPLEKLQERRNVAFSDGKISTWHQVIQFPVPVLTRWNTWFKSVSYVSEYLTDMIEFSSSSEMQNTPNAGVQYFSAIPTTEISKTQIQAVFVQEHAAKLASLTDSLEGSSNPTSQILHSKFLHVKECFAVAASGIFEPETTSLKEELRNKVLQAEVKQTLQRTASLFMDKLQEQMSTDPCRKTSAVVDNLFNPSSVVLNDVNCSLVTSFQTLPGMKRTNLTSADIARSYTRFAMLSGIFDMLFGISTDCPDPSETFSCVDGPGKCSREQCRDLQ
ncbi:hypothetical protein PR048_010838 [Dryococelus australis]|uniref:U1-type domain-containing protein n=1 Tax=Dryococelus australis TaxID=614101 RepID=A0ABQ9I493_9NEOP|nr:hypothetical protein PR048_010838 [Dryococelus australis]